MRNPLVEVEKQDRIVTLTINNPAQRNALSFELVDELKAAIEEIKADPEVRAVILTGAGKGFCSGADVSSMSPQPGMSEEEATGFIKDYYMKNLCKMKDSIGNSLSRSLQETMDLESRAQVECAKSEDLQEGITAFLEKREPHFKGK